MRNPFRKQPAPVPKMVPTGSKFPELVNLVSDFTPLASEEPWLAFEKKDGIRAILIDGRILSREGAELGCAQHCWPTLCDIEAKAGMPLMLDMEYQAQDGTFDSTESEHKRRVGEGICWIHDGFALSDWMLGGSFEPAQIRYEKLRSWMREIDSPFVKLLPAKFVTSNSEIAALAGHAWARGEEGLVIKRAASPYQRRRTPDWLKIKRKIVADLPILDVLFKGNSFAGLLCKGPTGPLKITNGFRAADASAFAVMVHVGRDMSDARARIAWHEKAGSNVPRHAHFLSVAP